MDVGFGELRPSHEAFWRGGNEVMKRVSLVFRCLRNFQFTQLALLPLTYTSELIFILMQYLICWKQCSNISMLLKYQKGKVTCLKFSQVLVDYSTTTTMGFEIKFPTRKLTRGDRSTEDTFKDENLSTNLIRSGCKSDKEERM